MTVAEYEKAILSVILRNASSRDRIPQRICFELDFDKFDPKGPNGIIYRAIQNVVFDKQVPNIPTVASRLGNDLDRIGGEEYLQSILSYLSLLGVSGSEGFETWVQIVDNSGRLRQLGLVISNYAKKYEDFQILVNEVKDVDEFIANFMSEINKGVMCLKSSYTHISEVGQEERMRLEKEIGGFVVDLIPTGWPSLERYHIPRPSTYGVISGLSSIGKTQFALQIALGAALYLKRNNLSGCIGINELESKAWRLHRRLACCLAGVDANELTTRTLSKDTLKRYLDTFDIIDELPIYFDDNPSMNSTKLVWNATAMHLEHGPRILGIADYIELFTDEGDSEELRVAQVVRNHRRVAWEVGSCEIAVSQMNNSVMHTSSKIGGKERSRYSGAIAHASDWYIEVYNPVQMKHLGIDFVLPDGFSNGCAYMLVEKNKDYSVGRESFDWTPEFTRFRDICVPGMSNIYADTRASEPDF